MNKIKGMLLVILLMGTLLLSGCSSMRSSILGYDVIPTEQLNTNTAILTSVDDMYGWKTEEIIRQIWVTNTPKILEGGMILPSLGIKKITDKNDINYYATLNFRGYSLNDISVIEKIVYSIDGEIYNIKIEGTDNMISNGNQFVPTEVSKTVEVSKKFVEDLSNARKLKCRIYTRKGYIDYKTFEYDDRSGNEELLIYNDVFQDSLKMLLKN